MESGIILKDVSFAYQKESQTLADISWQIKKGSFWGITGINGAGKSTLVYLLNGLIPYYFKGNLKGEVSVDGVSTGEKDVAFFAKKVGLVFQNPDFSLFNLSVEEEILFGLRNLNLPGKEERVKKALQLAGLAGFAQRDPQSLSLGEKQKVCLAAVLAMETDYLVLDEPTAQLDFRSAMELYRLLVKLNKNGKTIITVEHDTDFLWQFTRETLILHKGKIKEKGLTKKILSLIPLLKKLGIKTPNRRL